MKWVEDLRRLLARLGGGPPVGTPPGGIECHEALERVFEWLDDELEPSEQARVGEHLQTCALCYPLLQFEQAFREAVERARSGAPASEKLEERIMHVLEGEGFLRD